MIKWLTEGTRWGVRAKITPVNVERETDSSVWIKGGRRAKVSSDDTYHDTWEEAHKHLVTAAEFHAAAARNALEHANGALGNVKGMKKPDEAAKPSEEVKG